MPLRFAIYGLVVGAVTFIAIAGLGTFCTTLSSLLDRKKNDKPDSES